MTKQVILGEYFQFCTYSSSNLESSRLTYTVDVEETTVQHSQAKSEGFCRLSCVGVEPVDSELLRGE